MILPNKVMNLKYSLLGKGIIILNSVRKPRTVSSLWDIVKMTEEINTFDKFILTLDFLYILGLINSKNGLIMRVECNITDFSEKYQELKEKGYSDDSLFYELWNYSSGNSPKKHVMYPESTLLTYLSELCEVFEK
ncbi:ABC-three component system middle component 6 [Methanococcus maripaludis]|uniref:Uncharacterized protein n=1 Tax=Methanococcus maripaludis TaxID=39152 RepID=A0A8T4CNW0_METMI|nr:ABC-three component system middle component 6 [Methanococcus maripaludis]MBM7408763.1 hypothetical protein [Methanococcus maripaludis]MBP2219068.1 hypothetical protein [Methanococcus maripaludis]